MVEEIMRDAEERMRKSIVSLESAFKRIRTGRAHPAILDNVMVSCYGTETPLNQLAAIHAEEGRSLLISPWEKSIIGDIEKAILKSDLGLNPSNNGDAVRVPMPPLTEETRREYGKQARNEAEAARVAIRNIRREANADFRELAREGEISEDEARRAEARMQKLTDRHIETVDAAYKAKEADLLSMR